MDIHIDYRGYLEIRVYAMDSQTRDTMFVAYFLLFCVQNKY